MQFFPDKWTDLQIFTLTMKKTTTILLLLLFCSLARAVQYGMILPLQYNYYQPLDAAGLGGGQVTSLTSGPAALFGNPCRLGSGGGRLSASVSGGFISDGHSHVLITTRQSLALPAAAAAVWNFGKWGLGLGYANYMITEMSFRDQLQFTAQQQADLSLRQISAGGYLDISPGVTAGVAVCRNSTEYIFQKMDTMLARGSAPGWNLNAGIEISINSEMKLFTSLRTKNSMENKIDYLPQPGDGDLDLYGVVPAISTLGFSYRIDSTMTLAGQMDIASWQDVSRDYRGRADFKVGMELKPASPGYILRFGFFTMGTPLLSQLTQNYPSLSDMYFLSIGQSFIMGPVTFSFSAATSRLFSGDGIKQDMLAMSLQYAR